MRQTPVVAAHAELGRGSQSAAKQGNLDEQHGDQAPSIPPSSVAAGTVGAPTGTSVPSGSSATVTPRMQQQDQSAARIAVAVGEPLCRPHDDPSPTSQQPARKQKGARGNAVPRWRVESPAVAVAAAAALADPAASIPALPAALNDSPAALGLPPPPPPSAAPPEKTTAATVQAPPIATLPPAPLAALQAATALALAGSQLIAAALPPGVAVQAAVAPRAAAFQAACGRPAAGSASTPATPEARRDQPSATAAPAVPAAGPWQPRHRYAASYIECFKSLLLPQLRAKGGVGAVFAFADACGQLIQHLQDSQWVKVEYIAYDSKCAKNLGDEEFKVGRKDFCRGVDIVFNYGGQHLPAAQWEQRMQGCQHPSTLSSIDASALGKGFQVNLVKDCLRVELKYRYEGQFWYPTGYPRLHEQLWTGSAGDKEAAGAKNRPRRRRAPHIPVTKVQLPLFRKAAFKITVALLLLWHAQGKQHHPALESFAKTHLGALVPPQLATSTCLSRCNCL